MSTNTKSKSQKLESFPLIITNENLNNENNKMFELNEWSDQELDDLFQSPLEEVLDSMRFRAPNVVSRRHCLRSIIYLSLISFVFGASFSFVFITIFQFRTTIQISPQFSSMNPEFQQNWKQSMSYSNNNPFHSINNEISDKLLQQISSESIGLYLKYVFICQIDHYFDVMFSLNQFKCQTIS